VRRAVDDDPSPGRFILTGSAATASGTHSGAGRIVRLRMRPLTLSERGVAEPTVSLRELLAGRLPALQGSTGIALDRYAEEICRSGFPGLRTLPDRARRAQLDGYLDRVIDRDLEEEVGQPVRTAGALRRWLTAYGAATATTVAYDAIRDAATPGERDKPAKATALAYPDALERLWILDPLPAWLLTLSAHTIRDDDVRHLRWLRDQLGDDVLDVIVVTTGSDAYRRPDGIGVVPAALLGP